MKKKIKVIQLVVLLVLIFFLVGEFVRQTIKYSDEKMTTDYLKKFTKIQDLNTYEQALPRIGGGKLKKVPHAVLLLHGYSGSPEEFDHLIPALQKEGFAYYAPQILGFGLGDFHLIDVVVPSDWLRDAWYSYDFLTTIADKVSIIGHSTGTLLASYLSSKRPVEHLILIGPNYEAPKGEQFTRGLLLNKMIGPLLQWIRPDFLKPTRLGRITNTDTCDPVAAMATFQYPALSSQSLKTMWELQDFINPLGIRFKTLSIFYGTKDQTVNIADTLTLFDENHIIYDLHSYDRSCHNILDDYDKSSVISDLINILKSE